MFIFVRWSRLLLRPNRRAIFSRKTDVSSRCLDSGQESDNGVPELPAHTAVDDKVDGWVEDEEDVWGAEEHEEGDGDAVPVVAVAAVVEVLGRVVRRICKLVDLECEAVSVTDDEDQDNDHCN